MSRLESVLDLPYRVLRRYHAGYALYARSQDSEAISDLIAEGHLKLVRINKTLPEDLVGEDFRLRCLAILRRHYQNLYRKSAGLSWRRRTKTLKAGKKPRPKLVPFTEYTRIAATAYDYQRDPSDDVMKREAQEFLDGLGTAKQKVYAGVMEGRAKADIARELGMSVHQLTRLLGDTVVEMQEGGVL